MTPHVLILYTGWLILSALVIRNRLEKKCKEATLSSSNYYYISLCAALGIAVMLTYWLRDSIEWYQLVITLIFLAWSPVSLAVIFRTPRQLLILPVGSIILPILWRGYCVFNTAPGRAAYLWLLVFSFF